MTDLPYTPPKKDPGRFRIALASTESVQPEAFETLSYPLMASIKKDGVRASVSPLPVELIDQRLRYSPDLRAWTVYGDLSDMAPTPVTRSLKDVPNLHVRKLLATLPPGVDGEIGVVKDGVLNFRGSTSAIMSEDGEPDIRFYLFEHFLAAGGKAERYAALQALAPSLPAWCTVLEQHVVNNATEAMALYRFAESIGEEGLIFGRLDGHYKPHRSTLKEAYLIKAKGKERCEITVTGVLEEMENTNEQTRDERGLAKRSHHKAGKVGKGRAGKLVGRNEELWPGQDITVASGLDDALKAQFWAAPPIGALATIEYQSAGGYDLPRCPVFLSLRDPRDLS